MAYFYKWGVEKFRNHWFRLANMKLRSNASSGEGATPLFNLIAHSLISSRTPASLVPQPIALLAPQHKYTSLLVTNPFGTASRCQNHSSQATFLRAFLPSFYTAFIMRLHTVVHRNNVPFPSSPPPPRRRPPPSSSRIANKQPSSLLLHLHLPAADRRRPRPASPTNNLHLC